MAQDCQQDLLVHPVSDGFRVIGQVDREPVHEATAAAGAIQWAVDELPAGGEVRLARGEYRLGEPVRLSSDIRLCGSGRASRLIVEAEGDDAVGIEAERAKGVEVAELSIEDAGSRAAGGVRLTTCGDCVVRDVHVRGFAGSGIWLRQHTFLCAVRGCSVAGCGGVGIRLQNLREGPLGDYVPNLVADCIVYGGGRGIECDGAIVVNLVGNCLYQTDGPAFNVHNQSNSVLISGCRTFQITGAAVLVDDAHEFNCSPNIFCGLSLGCAAPPHHMDRLDQAHVNCQSFQRHWTETFIQRGFEGGTR